MKKDIIRNIISINEEKENYIKEKRLFSQEKKFSQISEANKERTTEKEDKCVKKIEDNEIINSKNTFLSINNDSNIEEDKLMNIKIDNVMKNLKVINILKIFFCFKDKKTLLINLCDKEIDKDLCVERILKRLYTLENFYNIFVEKDKDKLGDEEEISQIKNLIIGINRELNEKEEKKGEKKEEITRKQK